ncbi:MAG TPA: hypothetical protein VFZ11_11130 [Gemmatimonadaceae bacterium]
MSSGPPRPAGASAGGPSFDELAFLKSVIDPRAEGIAGLVPGSAPPMPESASPPPAAATPKPPEPTPVPGTPARGSPSPLRPRPSAVSSPREQEEPAAERPPAEPEVPEFLKDVPSEDVKTLRCAECGSMNYPTEWYCERCGAELTTM